MRVGIIGIEINRHSSVLRFQKRGLFERAQSKIPTLDDAEPCQRYVRRSQCSVELDRAIEESPRGGDVVHTIFQGVP